MSPLGVIILGSNNEPKLLEPSAISREGQNNSEKLSILSSVESKNPKPVNHNSESEETLYLEQRGIKESQIRQSQ